MSMFCYQCQETQKNIGCTDRGVCGKQEPIAKLQDLLVYATKGLSQAVCRQGKKAAELGEANHELLVSLFMTITNANFDGDSIAQQIKKVVAIRDQIKGDTSDAPANGPLNFKVGSKDEMIEFAANVGVLSTENPDIRSLRETITYGLKGMAAYTHHAYNIGKENNEIYDFMYHALNEITKDNLSVDDLVALVLKTGEHGVKSMALLDDANTSRYGHPEITAVDIGVRGNPGILISGHDLTDLEQLLEQTKGSGVDIYTHSEMLPSHYYPAFKKYDHFAGNYGGSWWRQVVEFEPFNGPILFTTNCIVPPRKEELVGKIYTTGATGYPGSKHIVPGPDGKKDFSELIAHAKSCPPPTELETGTIVGGFAHNQVFALADKVVDAVKSGAIRKFVVMAGCDGRQKTREYYTEFAEKLPKDVVILTAGCAKYRYNKLPLGDIGGIPRVLDAGQCNDSYSLAVIAMKLQEIFGLKDINELPIVFNIAWYEQKAAIVLLSLLYLGVKNIHVGPTLPGFLSENVAKVLVDAFGLGSITTVDQDIEMFFG